ncbi:electron transfer flavoprotein beta subunit lysine methyltransferase-like [Acanthaster planci]|uniref:ETFB lysine methyltransferase n=1 Tax=Acanthaster planci TaxID=133434 RepID=A0A8B7Y022_ACAPL|nr:electron transfer flavoprotein beta subunit lysine methyltransferase-like [Acanthaster planci]
MFIRVIGSSLFKCLHEFSRARQGAHLQFPCRARSCHGNSNFLHPVMLGSDPRMSGHKHRRRKSCYHSNPTSLTRLQCTQNGAIRGEEISTIKQFILDNTVVTRNHLTPEVALRLMTSSCRLWSAPSEQSSSILAHCGIDEPFWAFYWPGGQALTRYLLDNPGVVSGKSVLDVGSGCGASAIAAALVGAKSVLANDIDKVAIQAVKLNAEMNSVAMTTTSRNLIGRLADHWDVVLLGDMFYDKDFTDTVTDWLRCLADRGTEVLIGDPGRIFLRDHPVRDCLVNIFTVDLSESCRLENNGMTQGFVWKLQA